MGTVIVDALVLSGGRGTRLGRVVKAALELDGATLLERTLGTLGAARSVVVVGDAPPHLLDARVSATREQPAHGGPVAAIGAGLAALDARREPAADAVLVLAVDMPHVAPLVPELLAALATLPVTDAVLPLDESQRAQPLAALYRTAPLRRALVELGAPGGLAERQDRAASAGEHPAAHPLASLPVRALTARIVVETISAPPGSTSDVDTLDDAARLGVTVPSTTEGDRTP